MYISNVCCKSWMFKCRTEIQYAACMTTAHYCRSKCTEITCIDSENPWVRQETVDYPDKDPWAPLPIISYHFPLSSHIPALCWPGGTFAKALVANKDKACIFPGAVDNPVSLHRSIKWDQLRSSHSDNLPTIIPFTSHVLAKWSKSIHGSYFEPQP